MLSRFLILTCVFSILPARGEVVWKEDGKMLKTSSRHSTTAWFSKVDSFITPLPDEGFSLRANCAKYLTLRPGIWFTFELDSVKRLGSPTVYHAWNISYPKIGKLAGNVSNIPPGIYTFHLVDIPMEMTHAAQFYLYNAELKFRRMQLETAPENSLEVIIPPGVENLKAGSRFRIELHLKEPCEDVSCKFLQEYGRGPVPLIVNGTDSVDLKAVDKDCKIWVADVEIKTVKSPRRLRKRVAIVKVTILGGKLKKPIFTSFPVPIIQNPEPAVK